jgi:hypothetical protein
MAWSRPEFSRSAVDRAGRILISQPMSAEDDVAKQLWARRVINNWRSSHAFPLNTLQNHLRMKTRGVNPHGGFVAQRLKRLSAIQHKLERFPKMGLSRMQDIGGCRAVVVGVNQVSRLRQALRESRMKHKLVDEIDYIRAPKADGYRSHHIVYRYHSDRTEFYEGLKIEVQLRTKLQHAWATAVEIVGQIRHEMLKSDQGDEDWLRFFALMGTALARREECPDVPDTPSSNRALAREIRRYAKALDVVAQLNGYRTALSVAPALRQTAKDAHYFLLSLDVDKREISFLPFRKNQMEEASQQLQQWEVQRGPNVVLVSVDSAALIRNAYPNFYLDSEEFLKEVRRVIE